MCFKNIIASPGNEVRFISITQITVQKETTFSILRQKSYHVSIVRTLREDQPLRIV